MSLSVDLSAIAHNAAVVSSRCRAAGLVPVGVFKQAYAWPEIVGAFREGGITRIMASTEVTRAALTQAGFEVDGLLGVGWGIQAPADVRATTHIEPISVRNAFWPKRTFAWLEVLTSDGKQGMTPETLLTLLEELRPMGSDAADRIGLLFNWGCLGGPPTDLELMQAQSLITRANHLLGRSLPVSFGGSALLPMLKRLPIGGGSRQFRVGEAVLTGNVPAASGASLGLKRPIVLDATVVNVRRHGGGTFVMIDCGHSCIDGAEVAESHAWRVVGVATETTLIEVLEGPAPRLGAVLPIYLGYKSSVRCLLNRTLAPTFIDVASDEMPMRDGHFGGR